jgi:hypothetical protein
MAPPRSEGRRRGVTGENARNPHPKRPECDVGLFGAGSLVMRGHCVFLPLPRLLLVK